MTRRSLILLALAAAVWLADGAATLAIAPPALASGTVTVNIVGAGQVTGTGLDCRRKPGEAATGTCAHFVADNAGSDADCQPAPAGCPIPGEQLLRAVPAPGAGFAFDSWNLFCARLNPCTLQIPITFGSNRAITATFIDVQDPTAALTQPANGAAVAGRIPLTAVAADNGGLASVAFRVRGTLLAPLVTGPFTTVFDTRTLPDGAAAITVTATDNAGRATIPAAVNVTVDNTAPTLTLTGPDGTTLGPGAVPAWTIAAADTTTGPPAVQCSVVAAGAQPVFEPCPSATELRLPNQPDGHFDLTVRATDGAGNATEQSRTFTVDTAEPEPTITPGTDGGASTPPGTGGGTDGGDDGGGPGRPVVLSVALTYHYLRFDARTTTLDRLVVQSVPAGATVTASCSKNCSDKRVVKTNAPRTVSLKAMLKKPLKAGTKIKITVSKPGTVAAVKILQIRSRKAPTVTTRCLPPGKKAPILCPSA